MNFDPYTKQPIHRGEIWEGSRCLDLERLISDDISGSLESLGYKNTDGYHRRWIKGDRKVVLCLVDDIRSCTTDYETDMPYLFDRNTTVITDNVIMCPTQFQVINVPRSFFGIYHHVPQGHWEPDRQFCFSVNRLDDRRFKIMLELAKRIHLHHGYVNFNCQKDFLAQATDVSYETLRNNFQKSWHNLIDTDKAIYQSSFELVKDQMPLKNHDLSHDAIHLRSRCNIVVESYSSDTTVAFSEKIFRALCLPVPWTLYAGHYAVAYLESLGFDCMRDVIDHNHYDQLKEIEDRVRVFVWKTLDSAKSINHDVILQRCIKAAEHNQRLLSEFKSQWKDDFQQWCHRLPTQLKT